jgi:membrane-associated protease RseP (regulator of RpoE activity)|tara:strand:+ start:426 stop:1754 length:1329 start_codon:yes stop_codon:yes gene_type:complete
MAGSGADGYRGAVDVAGSGADGRRGAAGNDRIRLVLLVGAVVSFGLIGGLSGLVVVSSFVVMLVLHELGHLVVARLSGMQVTEFFIGFGPRLWSVRRGETTYGVKAIPAGAYVRITGMSSLEVVDPAVEHRTYRQQSYPKRMAVALAGSATHFAVALALLFFVYMAVGRPDPTRWVVGEVVSGSAAASIDVRVGDRIVSVAGVETPGFEDFGVVVRGLPGREVVVVLERDGDTSTRTMTVGERLRIDGTVAGFFGVGSDRPMETLGPVGAGVEASARFVDLVGMSVDGLVGFFTPDGLVSFVTGGDEPSVRPEPALSVGAGGGGSGQVADPGVDPADEDRLLSIYGAARLGSAMLDDGWSTYLWFLILVNVFIGVFNLVPLLPLDGGHVAIATYERIRSVGGRRHMADSAKLIPLTWAVVTLLVAVAGVALYRDIVDLPDFG